MTIKYTFLGKDTSVSGVITTQRIIVEGSVNGEINARDRVVIKNGAVVEGSIKTKKILLEEGARHNGFIRMSGKRGMKKRDPELNGFPAPKKRSPREKEKQEIL